MPVQIPQAHSIGDMIDNSIRGATSSLQFPSDRPKYYTTLSFSNYSFRTGTGGQPPNIGMTEVLKNLESIASGWVGDIASAVSTQAQSLINQLIATLQAGQQRLNTVSTPTGSIILPLPVNLVDVHKIKYDEKSILPWASIIGEALGGFQSDVFKIGGAFLGLAPNYYYTIIFDRPEYKRHELSFRLAPRNYQEAEQIRNIIREINNKMSPDIVGPGGTAAAFTFPDIVQVTLRPNAGFLFKFKPAVIESIAINYAGSGGKKAFYHGAGGAGRAGGDNPPESVEFTLHLLEIEYWLKNQFTIANE